MTKNRAIVILAALAAAAVVISGCSNSGGKQQEQGGAGLSAGTASTPRMKVAVITHATPGDTFWDIVQKGAQAAASKDNIEFVYSNDPDGPKQATLITNSAKAAKDKPSVCFTQHSSSVGFNSGNFLRK